MSYTNPHTHSLSLTRRSLLTLDGTLISACYTRHPVSCRLLFSFANGVLNFELNKKVFYCRPARQRNFSRNNPQPVTYHGCSF